MFGRFIKLIVDFLSVYCQLFEYGGVHVISPANLIFQ